MNLINRVIIVEVCTLQLPNFSSNNNEQKTSRPLYDKVDKLSFIVYICITILLQILPSASL